MSIPQLYENMIRLVTEETGASDTLLHVHAGLAVLFMARVVTGKSLATPIPFLTVLAAAVLNELMDRINHGAWLWADTGLDMVNTVFWPFLLMVGLRVRRLRERRPLDRGAEVTA